MTRGTGPPPPLGDCPHGIDISHPNYAIDSDIWHEPPKQFPETFNNPAIMTARTKNDLAYKVVGNATTWNRYVLFGYHAYDHCFQFDTQWERMTKNETDTLQFIWESYSYLVDRKLDIPVIVERWAKNIAQPHLLQCRPEALTVDTTDPRHARRSYTEADLMEIDSEATETSESSRKEADKESWTEIHGKKTRPAKEAMAIPLPLSPNRQEHNQPLLPVLPAPPSIPIVSPPTKTATHPHPNPFPKEMQKNGLKYVHLNDGTLRITVRWTPENYTELSADTEQWNYAATDIIHYILATASDALLYPWMNGSEHANLPSIELTPDLILQYLAPKITPIDSLHMYIFSFRLCLAGGPGKWINNKDTKNNLEQHNVEINVSNSSSDSGDQISVAGYIFFKHPKFTQRNYFLAHLRRNIQENTPFLISDTIRRHPLDKTSLT